MTTAALTILALFIFSAYLAAIAFIFRIVPVSLSDTYYMLEQRSKGSGAWFTLMMFAVSVLVLIPMMDVTPDPYRICAFLPPTGIAFVGAAPQFKDSFVSKTHVVAAVVAAVFGIAWTVLLTPCWGAVPFCLLMAFLFARRSDTLRSCKTFWLEMVAFGSVFIALLYMTFR